MFNSINCDRVLHGFRDTDILFVEDRVFITHLYLCICPASHGKMAYVYPYIYTVFQKRKPPDLCL